MLYIKVCTFIYIYLTVSIARMLAASMQCWRMVRALRSRGRWWLVVSSVEMSPYASHSRTSSVTDRRLITDLSTAPYDQKMFASSVERTLLWSCWQQNTAGPLKRSSPLTIASLHDITGSFTSCCKSHRLQTCLWLLHYVVLLTWLQCVV